MGAAGVILIRFEVKRTKHTRPAAVWRLGSSSVAEKHLDMTFNTLSRLAEALT